MQRRSFFKSLTQKAKKVTSSNCYELSFADSTLNVFLKNPNKPIFIINGSIAQFKNIDNLNFCYINDDFIKAAEIIKKQFNNSIYLISDKYIDGFSKYILINQEAENSHIEQTLYSYDYNYITTAQNYFKQQKTDDKDIFVSQLLEDNKLAEVFIQRIKVFADE